MAKGNERTPDIEPKSDKPATRALTTEEQAKILARRIATPVGIIPSNIEEAWRVANYLAASNIVPTAYIKKPNDIMACLMYGAEVGIKPMSALKNIAVINGRPSIWGDMALAIIMQHPEYEDHSEEEIGPKPTGDAKDADGGWGFKCTIKRAGKMPTVRTFTVADAKRAKLWMKTGREGGETPWVTYPQRMLQMRARSWAIRDRFPDALCGLSVAEEAMDMEPIAHPTDPAAEILMPRRVSQESEQEAEVLHQEEDTESSKVQVLDQEQVEQLEADREEYVRVWNEIQGLDKTWMPDPEFSKIGPEERKKKIEQAKQIQYDLLKKKLAAKPASNTEESVLAFDAAAPDSAPKPAEGKKKSEMTTAEKHLGPVEKREKPVKVLSGDYERVQAMHTKKLFIVLAAANVHSEKALYEKLWKSWGIESAKDIPKAEYKKVLAWAGGEKFKIE